jgi:N,N'-diacetyllegionaminate synthase
MVGVEFMNTLLISEIGQNHNGDINLAKEMIISSYNNGADVAKFQFYDAKKLFSKKKNPWFKYNLSTELSFDDIEELYSFCNQVGIEFMASTFDIQRLQFLESLGVKRHKIASRSIVDKALINSALETGKELIISLGQWNGPMFPKFETENKISFLFCVSDYPTKLNDISFSNVDFSMYTGFSDHTIGIDAAKVAVSRGAQIIEKHFTLDKNSFGPDHSCSMTPNELKELDRFRRVVDQCL